MVQPASSSHSRVSVATAPPASRMLRLPRDLELEGALQRPERVQVLDLRAGAERGLAVPAQRHVRIAPEAALFHVGVRRADGHERGPQAPREFGGVFGRGEVGLGDDLDEGHTAAVEIEVRGLGRVGEAFVQRLASVLLEVHADEPHRAGPPRRGPRHGPADRQRPVVLRNLIALRQVRVEVVLASEAGNRRHGAPESQRRHRRQVDRSRVRRGQRAGQTEARRARVRVRRRAEARGAGAEHLACRRELRVHLEANGHVVRAGWIRCRVPSSYRHCGV